MTRILTIFGIRPDLMAETIATLTFVAQNAASWIEFDWIWRGNAARMLGKAGFPTGENPLSRLDIDSMTTMIANVLSSP